MRAFFLLLAVFVLPPCSGEEASILVVDWSSVTLSITATGELKSSQSIELGPPKMKHSWQQKLSYLAPEGSWVGEGDKIMAFDAQAQHERLRELKNSLATEKQRLASQGLDNAQEREQLKLDLAEAKMALDKAEAKSKNIDGLMAHLEVRKLQIDLKIARREYEMARYRQRNRLQQMEVGDDIGRSEVERLNAEVNEQLQAIAAMEVKAPRDGIVVYKADHNGKKPAKGDQFTPVRKVVELPDLNKLIIESTVDEHQAHKIRQGDPVEIRIDAIPHRVFHGEVESLGRVVRVKSKEEPRKVFDVRILLRDADPEVLRPGMAARLSIIQGVVENAVAIPHNAIVYHDGQAFVRVKSVLGQRRQRVRVVSHQQDQVIVDSGLQQGDEVLL